MIRKILKWLNAPAKFNSKKKDVSEIPTNATSDQFFIEKKLLQLKSQQEECSTFLTQITTFFD